MSNLKLPDFNDYETANAWLNDGRRRDSRQVCYATRLYRNPTRPTWENPTCDAAPLGVMHHSTCIIRYWADGLIVLDTGGFDTVTTARRMNGLTPRGLAVNRLGGAVMALADYGPGTSWTPVNDRYEFRHGCRCSDLDVPSVDCEQHRQFVA